MGGRGDDEKSEGRALSWLRLEEPVPTPEIEAVFQGTRERIGYVRTAQRMMAVAPAVLVAQDNLSRSLMGPGEHLTPKEKELLALVVSVENRCVSCIFGHASRLRALTRDAVWVGTVEANYRHADLSARERALADYAVKLTRTPGEVEEADLTLLRDAGLSELEIVYAAGIVAFFNLSNRVNSGLGVRANREAYEAER